MDNLLRQIEPIKHSGMFFSTIRPDLAAPTVATRDIAEVATRLLLDPTWTGSADAIGKPVRYQQVPLAAFEAQMVERGMSAAMAKGFADMMAAKDAGLDNGVARTAETSTPTTFRQWCEDALVPALRA